MFTFFKRLFTKRDIATPKEDTLKTRNGFFSTHTDLDPDNVGAHEKLNEILADIERRQPVFTVEGVHDSVDTIKGLETPLVTADGTQSEGLILWFASNSFIGHQMCAIIAQHWLVMKACGLPARDAIRKGYKVENASGGELNDDKVRKLIEAYDKEMCINDQMREYITFGRIFGVRVSLFRITSTDPEYYEKPFNPDGITPGSYKGIVQIDPQWCSPILDLAAGSQPDRMHFYEPTYWLINGRRYHRSHLIIYIPYPVAKMLRPLYQFGGVSVPQRIMERTYAAERTANEAPHLALSKRTTVYGVDTAEAMANENKFLTRLLQWVRYRDNYGIKIIDKQADQISQFDTSLADLDAVIMTQYQLTAAAAEVPATKLLETQPKGWQSSGEYEESSYHETLESIQTHDLTPLLERHHLCVMRSYVAPTLGIAPIALRVKWEELDSPTGKELAEIGEIKSRTAINYANTQAFDQYDIRAVTIADKTSDYSNLPPAEPPDLDYGPEAAPHYAPATTSYSYTNAA